MRNSRRSRPFWVPSLVMVCCMTCLGCGPKGPELAKVSGKVTMDGKPLPDVTVFFSPTQGGRPSTGKTEADGRYDLYHTSGRAGVELGEHQVMIDPPENGNAGVTMGPPKTLSVPKDQRTQTIAAGKHEVNFDLTSGSKPK